MKEKIKTFILSLLIISSMVLTFRIWFSNELWPYGYNFFVMSQNNVVSSFISFFNIKNDLDESLNESSMSSPTSIILNEYGKRVVLNSDRPAFNELDIYVQNIIKNWVNTNNDKNVSIATKDEWFNAIKAKSIYVDYGLEYKTEAFTSIFNEPKSSVNNNIKTIKDFIILPHDNITDNLNILVKEGNSFENIIKFSINYSLSGFNKIISDTIKSVKNSNSSYAFEINLDKPSVENINNEIIFDPMVLINLEPILGYKLTKINTISVNKLNDNSLDRIIKSFNMSPNMIQRYKDLNENMFFIDNYATIKFILNESLEYRIINPNKGLLISKNNEISNYIAWSLNFTKNIYDLTDNHQFKNLKISQIVKEGNNLNISFDYYINSIPVVFQDNKHAVEFKFINGYLSSFKNSLETFNSSGPVSIKPIVSALDKIYNVTGNEFDGKINGASLEYVYDVNNDIIVPSWNILFNNKTKNVKLSST